MAEHGLSAQVEPLEKSLAAPVRLTEASIQLVKHNASMAVKMVEELLNEGPDFGNIPGVKGKSLFDPGASKIFNAYNCYTDYRVIHSVEEDELISYTIQAIVIHRASQEIVGTGIGACSTREVKYKYRYVYNPEDYGYSEEEVSKLKQNKEKAYRITNPEEGELVNTIVKMAAKRADTDAAQSLPGVGSALRRLFDPKSGNEREETAWRSFYNQLRALGISDEDAHKRLNIGSFKDWLAQGKTLNDAIEILAAEVAEDALKNKGAAPAPLARRTDPLTLKTKEDALRACHNDFGLQPLDVAKELGFKTVKEITDTPETIYRIVASARQPRQ
jgi:hypothetical protein